MARHVGPHLLSLFPGQLMQFSHGPFLGGAKQNACLDGGLALLTAAVVAVE
jgi:hypothetical protein